MTLPPNINPLSVPPSNLHVLPGGHLHSVPVPASFDHIPPPLACPSPPSIASSQAHLNVQCNASQFQPSASSPAPVLLKSTVMPRFLLPHCTPCLTIQPRKRTFAQVAESHWSLGKDGGKAWAQGSSVLSKWPSWSRARSGEGVQGCVGGDGKFGGLGKGHEEGRGRLWE